MIIVANRRIPVWSSLQQLRPDRKAGVSHRILVGIGSIADDTEFRPEGGYAQLVLSIGAVYANIQINAGAGQNIGWDDYLATVFKHILGNRTTENNCLIQIVPDVVGVGNLNLTTYQAFGDFGTPNNSGVGATYFDFSYKHWQPPLLIADGNDGKYNMTSLNKQVASITQGNASCNNVIV